MAKRTEFGRELLAGQWAGAEFGALATLWQLGAPVPYPVQLHGTELLLEFIGDAGRPGRAAAGADPPGPAELADLFEQCVDAMRLLARAGYAHGDLSPYNLLVHDGRLVMIDLPQIVDLAPTRRAPDSCTATARTCAPGSPAAGSTRSSSSTCSAT